MKRIIGIDLGTSTSEVAIMENGKPVVLKNDKGNEVIPSIIGIHEDGKLVVGERAKEQLLIRPEYTAREIKRLIGSGETVQLGDKSFSPEEASSFILTYLKEVAESYVQEEITSAVITVPAYFTDEQRRATVKAGELAGLQVERIINEPTAAALSYGLEHMDNEEHILVYDLGGGTLDVTVLEFFDGVLDVKASSGNNALGGKDFDEALMNHFFNQFKKRYKVDVSKDIRAIVQMKKIAEECKVALSTEEEYTTVLPFFAEKDNKPLSFEITMARGMFEQLIHDLIYSTKEQVDIALKDSNLEAKDIDVVLLVGGSTRIPLVKTFIEEMLHQEPQSLVDPDLAVVKGAAIQGSILMGEQDILITDVCPYTLGIAVADVINGMFVDDCYSEVIHRNRTIPTMQEKSYYTVRPNQDAVEIKVYQGDRPVASDNNFLGEFVLTDIPPAPANEEIKVMFKYDVNGILLVEATVARTGKSTGIHIETTGVKMQEEVDISLWLEAPKAKKYKRMIERAERLIEEYDDVDLEEAVYDLKVALIKDEDKEELDELKDYMVECMFVLED